MVVTNTLTGPFFTGDFPDIAINSVSGKLSLNLTVNNISVLSENYYPDSSGYVAIRDLGELLINYIDIPKLSATDNNYTLSPVDVAMTLTDTSDTKSFSFKVYYSKCSVNFSPVAEARFFSRYKKIQTAEGRKEFISFLYTSTLTFKIGVAYMSNGKPLYKRDNIIIIATPIDVVAVNVSPAKIASICSVSAASILWYDLYLTDGNYQDTIRYNVDRNNHRLTHNFLYNNVFGMPENISFTGSSELNPEITGDTVEILKNMQRIDAGYNNLQTLNTGYIDKAKYCALLDMITSPHIISYDDDNITEVVITDIDFQHNRPSNEPIAVTLTYRPAKKNHHSFFRSAYSSNKIFDKSFDITFN